MDQKRTDAKEVVKANVNAISEKEEPKVEMSELMKAHLDEVAGGLAGHSSWYSIN